MWRLPDSQRLWRYRPPDFSKVHPATSEAIGLKLNHSAFRKASSRLWNQKGLNGSPVRFGQQHFQIDFLRKRRIVRCVNAFASLISRRASM